MTSVLKGLATQPIRAKMGRTEQEEKNRKAAATTIISWVRHERSLVTRFWRQNDNVVKGNFLRFQW